MTRDEVATPITRCPGCSYKIDSASALDGSKVRPRPGDLSLCFHCSLVLMFEEDLTVREATIDEIAELPTEMRALLAKASLSIRLLRGAS